MHLNERTISLVQLVGDLCVSHKALVQQQHHSVWLCNIAHAQYFGQRSFVIDAMFAQCYQRSGSTATDASGTVYQQARARWQLSHKRDNFDDSSVGHKIIVAKIHTKRSVAMAPQTFCALLVVLHKPSRIPRRVQDRNDSIEFPSFKQLVQFAYSTNT